MVISGGALLVPNSPASLTLYSGHVTPHLSELTGLLNCRSPEGIMSAAEASLTVILIHLPQQPVILPADNDSDIEFLDLNMSEALNRTFQELRSKNEDVRVKAAHDVYTAVVVAARGERPSILSKLED